MPHCQVKAVSNSVRRIASSVTYKVAKDDGAPESANKALDRLFRAELDELRAPKEHACGGYVSDQILSKTECRLDADAPQM